MIPGSQECGKGARAVTSHKDALVKGHAWGTVVLSSNPGALMFDFA